jgi:hypothetical protein
MMGVEPDPEDMPVEFQDLDYDCQMAINLFHILPDKIDGMGGNWLGKEWAGLFDIMEIYEISEKKDTFEYMIICQSIYAKHYSEQKKLSDSRGSRG